MGTTAKLDLPYPEGSATPNVPYDMQQLAEAVEGVLLPSSVTISPASGWTVVAGFAVHRVGSLVAVRGEIYGGTDGTTIGTLPVGYRPNQRCAFFCPRAASSLDRATVWVGTDGVMTLNMVSGTVPTGSPGISLAAIQFPTTNDPA